MLKDLYIIGAGGHGRDVAWLVERANAEKREYEIKGFLDDDPAVHGTFRNGYEVLGATDYLNGLKKEFWVICGVANTRIKKRIVAEIQRNPLLHFATVTDPSVILARNVTIGEGSVVCAGTIIMPNSRIGAQVAINISCTIGHDGDVRDYASIHPGCNISGNAVIHEGAEIGTGTRVIPGKEIGRFSIVGAGSTVIKDIPENCVAVGSPAGPIKYIR